MSSTSGAAQDCAAELAAQQEFQEQMNALPVQEPSASFLAAARMRLQESLETAQQNRAWYHRLAFDPMAWMRQVRFSPALAMVIFLVGFGGGLGAMYSAKGTITSTHSSWAVDASIGGITSIEKQPGTDNVKVQYDKRMPASVQGSVSDPKVQDLLLYAAKSNENSGVRLNSVDVLSSKADDPRVRETLTYALRYDSNPGVRLMALEGVGPLVKAGHSSAQCRAGSPAERQQSGSAQRRPACAGAGPRRQQRAHGPATVVEGRSQRVHSHRVQTRAGLDAKYLLGEIRCLRFWCIRSRKEDWLTQGWQFKAAMRKAKGEDFGAGRGVKSRTWTATAGLLIMAAAIPLWAQQSRIYRDGTSWVEEISGTLPATRQVRIITDLGSVQVQGNAPTVTYVIRKRSFAPSQEAARRQFEQMHISAIKNAEGDFIEGRLASRTLNRFNAEFVVQIPRELEMVKVETRGGSLNFSSIVATVLGATGAGSVTLDNLDGSVKITSGGGNVEVGRLGSDFSLTTGGGDVHIKNVGGLTRINIGGGKVYVGSTKGADIQTGAGNIEVRKCNGDLGAVSGGGNLNSGRDERRGPGRNDRGECASGQRQGTGAGLVLAAAVLSCSI